MVACPFFCPSTQMNGFATAALAVVGMKDRTEKADRRASIIVVEVASDCAVLNADDALVLKMSGYTEAKHICYVTLNPQHVLVREHVRAGGRACALEAGVNGQMITLYEKGAHIPLLWTHLIPATLEGRATHNVQNAMFAAAMAFSLGIKLDAAKNNSTRATEAVISAADSQVKIFVVPTNEELVVAREAKRFLETKRN